MKTGVLDIWDLTGLKTGNFVVLGLVWFFYESGGEDAEGPILRTAKELLFVYGVRFAVSLGIGGSSEALRRNEVLLRVTR